MAKWEEKTPGGRLVLTSGVVAITIRHSGGGYAWSVFINGVDLPTGAGYVRDDVENTLEATKNLALRAARVALADSMRGLPFPTDI